jgi:hypothetical protein
MNADDKSKPQGSRQEQKSSGTNQGAQQQAQSGEGRQYGEGSYSGTRQYNEGLKKHMNQHDIEREALDAAPKSESEAREMEAAEREGRSKSRGEGASADGDPRKGQDLQK